MTNPLDTISDDELRGKLTEHGYPILPITATTRNFLSKMLKVILCRESKPKADRIPRSKL